VYGHIWLNEIIAIQNTINCAHAKLFGAIKVLVPRLVLYDTPIKEQFLRCEINNYIKSLLFRGYCQRDIYVMAW